MWTLRRAQRQSVLTPTDLLLPDGFRFGVPSARFLVAVPILRFRILSGDRVVVLPVKLLVVIGENPF